MQFQKKLYLYPQKIRKMSPFSDARANKWPNLGVDLEIDSLRHPERYPLVIKRNALDLLPIIRPRILVFVS